MDIYTHTLQEYCEEIATGVKTGLWSDLGWRYLKNVLPALTFRAKKKLRLFCEDITSLQRSEEGRFFSERGKARMSQSRSSVIVGCTTASARKRLWMVLFVLSWFLLVAAIVRTAASFSPLSFPGCTTLYYIARNKSAIQLHFHQEFLWQKQFIPLLQFDIPS